MNRHKRLSGLISIGDKVRIIAGTDELAQIFISRDRGRLITGKIGTVTDIYANGLGYSEKTYRVQLDGSSLPPFVYWSKFLEVLHNE